ncbi:isotocin receptor-like [Syngnathoides biaculeatus]|uniref:isotocin receptor-like n=1 Tax=Syngnathoides biaculeatus TaxID=300417 RepID=UPI002ADE85C2|nr:isotocin receptor-like [Syngnathoides biaculeatus]
MEELLRADDASGPHNSSWGKWRACENGSQSANTTGAANPLKRNDEVAKAEVAVLVLVLLLAFTGNLCVLWAIRTAKPRQSRMLYFMRHLSIADLVVAVFQVLPQLIWDITFRFYGPDVLCRLVKFAQVVGMFASTYLLVLMSVDRCLAVCRPLRPVRRTRDRVCVAASWLLSLIFSTPQVYIFSMRDIGDGVYDCWGDFGPKWGAKAYVMWMSLSIYILPVGILSVCYGLICVKIWQNFNLKTRREHFLALAPKGALHLCRVSSVSLISKAKIRTVKMTFVVVLAYIVCWTPFFFVQIWSAWDDAAPQENTAFIIAMLLASLNSCCNPWIYMFFAGHMFQGVMRSIFCCRCYTSARGRQHDSSPAYTVKKDSGRWRLSHTSSTGGPAPSDPSRQSS